MAINFGGCEFTEPILVACWSPPSKAGLYAVLVRDDGAAPRRFRAIYFGETENFSDRGFLGSHHRYDSWIREAGGSDMSLYIAICPTPDSTRIARLEMERSLIDQYAPLCNRQAAEGPAMGPQARLRAAPEQGTRVSMPAGAGIAPRAAAPDSGLASVGLKVRR